MTAENHMAVDNKIGLLINVGYDRGFTTAMYLSTEIVNNANMDTAIVVPITKLTSLQLMLPMIPPNQPCCTYKYAAEYGIAKSAVRRSEAAMLAMRIDTELKGRWSLIMCISRMFPSKAVINVTEYTAVRLTRSSLSTSKPYQPREPREEFWLPVKYVPD